MLRVIIVLVNEYFAVETPCTRNSYVSEHTGVHILVHNARNAMQGPDTSTGKGAPNHDAAASVFTVCCRQSSRYSSPFLRLTYSRRLLLPRSWYLLSSDQNTELQSATVQWAWFLAHFSLLALCRLLSQGAFFATRRKMPIAASRRLTVYRLNFAPEVASSELESCVKVAFVLVRADLFSNRSSRSYVLFRDPNRRQFAM